MESASENGSSGPCFFKVLPEDVIVHVFSFLDAQNLCNSVSPVCKEWYSLSKENSYLWHPLCENKGYSSDCCGRSTKRATVPSSTAVSTIDQAPNWKLVYREHVLLERAWRKGKYKETILLNDDLDRCVYVRVHGDLIAVCGGVKGHSWLWDRHGTLLCTYEGHSAEVSHLEFDDEFMVTASSDGTSRVFDVNTGECLQVLEGHRNSVHWVEYDGTRVITGSCDCDARVWDPRSGKCLHTLSQHIRPIVCMTLHGNTLVTGGEDHHAVVWDVVEGTTIFILNPALHVMFSHPITAVEINDTYICVGTDMGILCLFSTESGEFVQFDQACHAAAVWRIILDGTMIYTAGLDGSIKIRSISMQRSVEYTHGSSIWWMEKKGNSLVTAGEDKQLKVWDIPPIESELEGLLGRWAFKPPLIITGHTSGVGHCQVSERLIATCSSDGTARIYDFSEPNEEIEDSQ